MSSVVLVAMAVLGAPPTLDAQSVYRRARQAVVTVSTASSVGTGFVVGDGTLILTCHHVVEDGGGRVKVVGEGTQDAVVVAQDKAADVAVLRVRKAFKTRLTLSRTVPSPGARVYVIGTPLGVFERTISEGIVSGIRKMGGVGYVQVTAPISEGSSGSPVLTENGSVVGMAAGSMKDAQALNFAIGAGNLRDVLSRATSGSKARGNQPPSSTPRTKERSAVAWRNTVLYERPSVDAEAVYKCAAGETVMAWRVPGSSWSAVAMTDGKAAYAPPGDLRFKDEKLPSKEEADLRAILRKIDAFNDSSSTRTDLVRKGPGIISRIVFELSKPDANGNVRKNLAIALGEMGASAKAPTLKMLYYGNRLQMRAATIAFRHAIKMDKDFPDEEVVSGLCAALVEHPGAMDAAEALREIRDPSAIPDLINAIRLAPPAVSGVAWKAIVEYETGLTVEQGRQAFEARLKRILDAGDWAQSSAPTASGGGEGESRLEKERREGFKRFQYWLNYGGYTQEDSIRSLINWLGFNETPTGRDLMIQLLDHRDPRVRFFICDELEERGDPEALKPLVTLLKDVEPSVRGRALAAIGRLGKGAHMERMTDFLASSIPSDRAWGVIALGKTRQVAAVPGIIGRSRDLNAEVRLAVTQALQHFRGRDVEATLSALTADPNPNVREAARKALESVRE